MNMNIFFILLVLIFTDAQGSSGPPPPPPLCVIEHEYITDCGTACPLTCDNYLSAPLICTEECVHGCFCKDGYVRDSAGKCVLPETCPANGCEVNEVWAPCSGYCFEENCRNLIPPVAICRPAGCVPGCVCAEGFYRSENGKCISAAECGLELCPEENQELVSCTGPCDATCENPLLPQMCRAACGPGCGCKKGFVRDENGKCVALEDCPKKKECGLNEEYSECGANKCQNTCENPTLSFVCKGICISGCICRAGYIRDSNGECIPEYKCPKPTCPSKYEYYTDCGTACPLTCDNYKLAPLLCTKQCVRGCFCKYGYVRDYTGKCVPPKSCLFLSVTI